MLSIVYHRRAGRAALLSGDFETAFDELLAARHLEPKLDHLGAEARDLLPAEFEMETDLTPLARALSTRQHPRASDAWRCVLEDRPARSIQAEAAQWLALDALRHGHRLGGLRALHAASELGHGPTPDRFHALYREAGIDPHGAFELYLGAVRLDPGNARALGLHDPLTDASWPDQDARWWLPEDAVVHTRRATDHQAEALGRARDLALTHRDRGWLLLAEGDYAAAGLGVRTLGRIMRTGNTEQADADAFVHIRVCYESAAESLPDVAWPWYRLSELLAWAGFCELAAECLEQAERRTLGSRASERANRPALRGLVEAGMGHGVDGMPTATRPFPAEIFGKSLTWRLRRH
jgi:hypothetical protein